MTFGVYLKAATNLPFKEHMTENVARPATDFESPSRVYVESPLAPEQVAAPSAHRAVRSAGRRTWAARIGALSGSRV